MSLILSLGMSCLKERVDCRLRRCAATRTFSILTSRVLNGNDCKLDRTLSNLYPGHFWKIQWFCWYSIVKFSLWCVYFITNSENSNFLAAFYRECERSLKKKTLNKQKKGMLFKGLRQPKQAWGISSHFGFKRFEVICLDNFETHLLLVYTYVINR